MPGKSKYYRNAIRIAQGRGMCLSEYKNNKITCANYMNHGKQYLKR